MTHFTIAVCTWWLGLTGIGATQLPVGMFAGGEEPLPPVKTVAAPPRSGVEILAPVPQLASPGEALMTREARMHERNLLQSQAQAESVHRAAVARAEQRTRRLESQRWFGISNARPMVSPDPYNGDYSPGWVSNYPFFPYRWVGGGEPWGYAEGP